MPLQFLFGVGILLVSGAMLWFARPATGQDTAPFLRIWIVSQIYMMVTMVGIVLGITFLIFYWPF